MNVKTGEQKKKETAGWFIRACITFRGSFSIQPV
jgi:hypothetical protein